VAYFGQSERGHLAGGLFQPPALASGKTMDTALSALVSIGIVAFGIWCVAGGIGPHLTWSLLGLLPILVGLFSLYETAISAASLWSFLWCPL
jgi:hypothetical protein